MKLFFSLLLLIKMGWADQPERIWKTPDAAIIETTETRIAGNDTTETYGMQQKSSPLQDVPADKNLDDIPLAKTYPVDAVPSATLHPAVTTEKEPALPKTERTPPKPLEQKSKSLTNAKLHDTPSTHIGKETIALFLQKNAIWIALIALIFLALSLLSGLRRRKGKQVRRSQKSAPAFRDSDTTQEQFAELLESFSRLKGDVHQRFLLRKQNILFNDDFTYYQKAKALLELEREYTEIEFVALPGLFSPEPARFREAKQKLSSYPELRDLVYDFIESPLHQRCFTKEGRTLHAQGSVPGFYPSAHQAAHKEREEAWHDDEAQRAYLLQ